MKTVIRSERSVEIPIYLGTPFFTIKTNIEARDEEKARRGKYTDTTKDVHSI